MGVDQLLGAPAAAHESRAETAAALDDEPDGGMLPPSQVNTDCWGSASGAFVAVMYPLPFSHVYAPDFVLIWLWQLLFPQLPAVPAAR